MKDFYLIWTYSANYSPLMKVRAESALSAQRVVTDFYGPDFRAKASVFVFEQPPTAIYHQGRPIPTFEEYTATNPR